MRIRQQVLNQLELLSVISCLLTACTNENCRLADIDVLGFMKIENKIKIVLINRYDELCFEKMLGGLVGLSFCLCHFLSIEKRRSPNGRPIPTGFGAL